MNKLLEVNHLKKIYHDKSGEIIALDDISFDIKENEFVAINFSGIGGKIRGQF